MIEPPHTQPAPGDDAVAAPGLLAERSQKKALLDEQRQSWAAGTPLRPEDLLARWPTNPKTDRDVASLLFEDWRQRRQHGEDASQDDYQARFPEQRDSLKSLLQRHDVMRSLGGSMPSGFSLTLPDVGDEIFGFRLRQELGRGAFARVFLGEQAQLAGRPVVLKISQKESSEPQTLAQLQHTNIVPIYSLHEDANAGLQLVCMPYFGGASLSHVLRAVRAEGKQPQHGSELAAALGFAGGEGKNDEQGRLSLSPPLPFSPPRMFPACDGQPHVADWARLNYLHASVWIIARLADALDHAHQRGILHRDIKPSNILLAADGEPLLLDFNLAQNAHDPVRASLGGTVAYMAPEHLRAMASRDPVAARSVDQRADIYSLGMVLFEMLVGERPFEQSASYSPLPALIEAMAVERSRTTPSLRARRPDVPWSLESIIRKCLAPEPPARYQRAGQLADDLRAFLHDQPLAHAPELSRVERLRKWLRRHPRLASSGSVATVAAALLLTAGATLSQLHQHLRATQAELHDADERERGQAFDAGALRALCLVNTASDWANQDHVERGIAECEEALGLYGVLTRGDWLERGGFGQPANRDRAETTRELLLLLARARVQKSPGDPAVLRDAVTLLDKADALTRLRPTPALWEDRADYLGQLGEAAAAESARARALALPPVSARDHYLLASGLIRREGVHSPRAYQALQEAIRCNPKHYWSYMQRGAVHFERGAWTLAARDFGICKGFWPDLPLGAFNLGCIYMRTAQLTAAVAEFTDAIDHDPTFTVAYLNRGLARLELKRYEEALADFAVVGTHGRTDAVVANGRGVALEGLGRHAEADRAFAESAALADKLAPAASTRLRWVYGFAVSARLPDKARAAFETVLDERPDHPQALYGLGLLAASQDRPEAAVAYFDRALAADSGFVEARRFRGVLQARRGRLAEAMTDINWCLDREPKSGATLYAAACVASLAIERADARAVADTVQQAATCLQRALQHGYGRHQAATDPDLAALRRQPIFQRILTTSTEP